MMNIKIFIETLFFFFCF